MERSIFLKHHEFGLRVIDACPTAKSITGFYWALGLLAFFFIFEIWDIVIVYEDLEMLIDNLVSTVGVVLGLCKMLTLRWKRRNLKFVLNEIVHDWNIKSEQESSSEIFLKNFMLSQFVSKLVILVYNSMNFMYFLKTVISYIFDPVEERKFLARVAFPIDARQSPIYEITVIAQFLLASICFNSQALIEGLLAILVLHACSKIDVVEKEIMKFSMICQSDADNNKLILKTFRKLTQKHVKFIKFFEVTQDIFSFVTFFHIFFLTLVQVFSGYMFIDGLERGAKPINLIHYAVLTTSFLLSAGYYCIAGEYLTTKSEKIFNELCNCCWYEFPTSDKKLLSFILIKARKPVNLTVGKFSNLSLTYFTRILKTSFSYLSLVRAVR